MNGECEQRFWIDIFEILIDFSKAVNANIRNGENIWYTPLCYGFEV